MEKQFQLVHNGQQVQQSDFNDILGETSGLADDRVLAELLRMIPYNGSTVARGILPYGHEGVTNQALVLTNGANGSVLVNPFRAVIGSRTAVGTDAKKNWRDIRSTIAVGTTTLTQVLSITANSSGNPRWDLVVAAVAVDANTTPAVMRKVKNPTTGVVTDQSVAVSKETKVTLSVVAGTPAGSPVYPATPADSAGTYYIPLAYIRVPNGFNGTATVANGDINEVAPVMTLSSHVGGYSVRPASSCVDGPGLLTAGTSTQNGALSWTTVAGTKPAQFLAPSMVGAESIILALDLANLSAGNWSHQNGDVLDDSRDWRRRIFRWMAAIGNDGDPSGAFPWKTAGSTHLMHLNTSSAGKQAGYSGGVTSVWLDGMGSSFLSPVEYVATIAASGASSSTPAAGYNAPANVMAAGTAIGIFVDATTGALKLNVVGFPRVSAVLWIDASGQFPNP